MNEDIIKLAREAGWPDSLVAPVIMAKLAEFAALVRADEREACAKVCDDKAKETFSGHCQVWGDYFARAIRERSDK
jgi:hypothetical protein